MSKRAATAIASSPGSAKKVKSAAITSFFKTDGVTQSSTPRTSQPAKVEFDKDEWLQSLDTKHKDLLKLEIETLDESWLSALHQEFTKPYFLKLKEYLAKERSSHTVFPPERDVYSWSRHTPLDRVKIVIVGQDPYHNVGQAHGLCFSVQAPTPAPPSLKNMYKAIKNDYPSFTFPKHGSLLSWADQGVLLLNTCLTVRAHEANSHQKQGWEQFTQRVLDVVATHRDRGVVFMAWGKPAAERVKKLDTKKHLKLESVHPSPLSAARGFFDCGHFLKANDWLTSRYGVEAVVDWNSPSRADNKAQKTTESSRKPPPAPTKEDEVGQVGDGDALPQQAAAGGRGGRGKPAPLDTEESFGISKEEEEMLAAAQDEARQAD